MVKVSEKKDLWGNKDEEWKVESFTTPKKFYMVRRQRDKLTCDCPAFKKSKKECKHIRKVLGKKDNDDYELKCKNGLLLSDVVSALQKMIRRGKEYEAIYFGYCMHISGFGRYLWRRICVVQNEDVGLGNPMAPVVVNSLRQMWESNIKSVKEPRLEDFLFPLQAILFLCRAPKLREGDTLANIVQEDFKAGLEIPIPEVALDPHTAKGKVKWGRWNEGTPEENRKRVQMWFDEWSKVIPKVGEDKWEEVLKGRWGYYG